MKLPKIIINIPVPQTVQMFFKNLKDFASLITKSSLIALGVSLVMSVPTVIITMFIDGSMNPSPTSLLVCRILLSMFWIISFIISFTKFNEER